MTRPGADLDAVVVGANVRGLVTARVLDSLGYRAVVVDRSPHVGGADASFTTAGGAVFDHGFHVLDEMRAELATRLFVHALGGRVHRQTLRRGIVLRGAPMPYAPDPADMPPDVRALLHPGDLLDDIGDAPPTRARVAECYGPGFADLVFDEVLASYPTEARHLAFGVDEALLLTNVYPWFFPKAKRAVARPDESRAFHDRLREGTPQTILYPAEGGFGAFAEALAGSLDPDRVELVLGASDLRLEVGPDHRVDYVEAGGRRLVAPRYFVAGSWPWLCAQLGLPCQDVATDRVVLGSLRLDRAPVTDYHEVLVGDPRFALNRVHFPSLVRGGGDHLVQVEFAVPVADAAWELSDDAWRGRWRADLADLGFVPEGHRVEEFDVRSIVMHFNGYGAEGEALRDADPGLLDPGSNVHPVVPSMANLNLNRYVPRVVREVAAVLSEADG